MDKKIKIELKKWEDVCEIDCYSEWGTSLIVNDELLLNDIQDTKYVIEILLKHLGIEAEVFYT